MITIAEIAAAALVYSCFRATGKSFFWGYSAGLIALAVVRLVDRALS
jgi:hypothetical protein